MRSRIVEGIILFVIVLVIIAALGYAMAMHSFTIIEWWKPVALSAILAFPISIPLAKYVGRLTRRTLKYIEYPSSFILTFSIILAVLYSANFYFSDSASGYEYKAPVIRKYSQERTRTNKIGRRGYKTTKYYVYLIEIEMIDGKIKKLEKTLSEYNRIKRGSCLDLFIEDGLFHVPVIKPGNKQSESIHN